MGRKIFDFLILVIMIMAGAFSSVAQNQKEKWQEYLSYTKAIKVAIAPGRVYCATEGGLVYFDRTDNSINRFSGTSGLSDTGIRTIAYSSENNVLVVAYENSNIDLVYENRVINIPDIKRKQLTGKNINNITFLGSEAYLSCSFGIVVLNLAKQEVKDTYIIGDNGSYLEVFDVEEYAGFLYAATINGISRAEKNGTDLLNFENWNRIGEIPHAGDKYNHLAVHSGRLIANYTPEQWYEDEMISFDGNRWEPYLSGIRYVNDFQVSGNYLVIASRDQVFLVNENHEQAGSIKNYNFPNRKVEFISPRSAALTDNGILWIADYENSLVKISGETHEQVQLSGPIDNVIYSLSHTGNELWITAGNKTGWEKPRFQKFSNSTWKYYNETTYPELTGFHNILDIAVDPADPAHFFAASWGGGLLEFRGDQFVKRYTHKNSPLQTILPPDDTENYIRIGGLDFDSEGNLWMTNSEVAKNLMKLSPSGEWEAFALPEVANIRSIGKVIVTENDDKWIVVPRGYDAYVVDKTGTTKRRLLVTSYFNNGENEIFNRMNDIYSIAEDRDGSIWIGTSKGVAVYNNPQRIWNSESFYAIQPSLDLNDGLYHPLLETETVSAIAVDGANRKWLGTSNSGIFLISENGEEEILHFTQENSPLLSNTINDIAINHQTGEVFIGTSKGLISYQSDAIGGKDNFADVYVYPNPVRETYDGPVVITGLMENTDVKITDISGNLVHHSTSLGGQVSWDGNNLNGSKVRTGIYLVFCTDDLGEETHIAKIMFIN